MYLDMVWNAFVNIFLFALHITTSGAFPKPLSAADERECLERIATGDMEARNKLIEHNLRLVAHIVKKYYTLCDEHDDLISIGILGLMKAATTFKADRSVRFATYASRCIENEILMSFRVKKKSAGDVYISDPIDVDHDGNSLTLIDIMAEDHDMVELIDTREKHTKLHRLIDQKLNPRERTIVNMRYGFNNELPLTQREVAKKMDISRSYVSRIEKKAIEVLREEFEKV